MNVNELSNNFLRSSGGLEAFEDKLKVEEDEKEERIAAEVERRLDISSKTRSRLNKLIDRKKSEANKALPGGSREKVV